MIRKQIRPAITATLVLMVITGFIYPGIVTGLAKVLFPSQANGSVVTVDGRAVGSSLIGQQFTQPWYFHSRPSAAGDGYDATASSGTNKGPTDRKLADTLIAGAIANAEKDGAVKGQIPADMVTASASGLDPHISPANAEIQVARVAAARANRGAWGRRVEPRRALPVRAQVRLMGRARAKARQVAVRLEATQRPEAALQRQAARQPLVAAGT